MKGLIKWMENLGEKTKGNKYLHTTYDALATFLFSPKEVTKGGTHIKDGMDLKRTMMMVVIALQFALLWGMYNIGHQHYLALGMLDVGMWTKFFYGALQMLPMIVIVNVVGLGIEFLFAANKGHGVEEGFLVSGMLIPLIMPPDIPLWIVVVATAFAVVLGKEAFGGTGMNVLNVALLARVFIFFAYPTSISGDICWVSYDYNFLHNLFGMDAISAGKTIIDGFSGATPLGLAAKGGMDAVFAQYSQNDLIWGILPGSIGEVSKIGILAGAVMLLVLRIASWRVMLSMVIGCIGMGLLLNTIAPSFPDNLFLSVPWYYHLVMGSFLFAMAFMATDPVTASSTNRGKWIYGFLIGAIGLIIRVLNPAYPEGWMLGILLMNVFAPLIDHYVVQGHIKRRLARA